MKYKVGDKVRVRRGLNTVDIYGGVFANSEMVEKEIVTIASVNSCYYRIEEDSFCWTEEMLEELVEDELTAEETIRLKGEMCENTFCSDCEISDCNNGMGIACCKFLQKYPERVIKILKQWKKDHEKKQIETECMWYVQIVETDTHILKHEEPLKDVPEDKTIAKVLEKWCSEHEGKYYAISERRWGVKE